jgi:hypothetical protein
VFKHIPADAFTAINRRQRRELSLSAIGDFFLRGHPGQGGFLADVGPVPGRCVRRRPSSTEVIAQHRAFALRRRVVRDLLAARKGAEDAAEPPVVLVGPASSCRRRGGVARSADAHAAACRAPARKGGWPLSDLSCRSSGYHFWRDWQ